MTSQNAFVKSDNLKVTWWWSHGCRHPSPFWNVIIHRRLQKWFLWNSHAWNDWSWRQAYNVILCPYCHNPLLLNGLPSSWVKPNKNSWDSEQMCRPHIFSNALYIQFWGCGLVSSQTTEDCCLSLRWKLIWQRYLTAVIVGYQISAAKSSWER